MVELSCEGDIRYAKTFMKAYGGDAINTAVAARRLGSKASFITRLGDDAFAVVLKETMLKEGLEISGVRHGDGQTGVYFVAVDTDGEREFSYYRQNSAASHLGSDDINPKLIAEAKVVFASGVTLALSKNARQAVRKAFSIAREHGVTTAFDPNYRPNLWKSQEEALDALTEILPLVDVILPTSHDDTQDIVGFSRPEQVIDYFLFKGCKLVVAKVGQRGCYLGYQKHVEHVPAMTVKAVDTTGAGDAFNGGFLHGLATGQSLIDCARLANTTAGLKVLNRGTISAMPYRDAVYSRVFSAVH